MADTWTKAAKVRRAFKAGRPSQKNRVIDPERALYEACILLGEVRDEMVDAGLSQDDVQAALVLVTPETPGRENMVYVQRVPQPEKLPELFENVAEIEKLGRVLPLGILIWQLDREIADPKENKIRAVVWPHPFLIGDRATKALKRAGDIFMASSGASGGQSAFN